MCSWSSISSFICVCVCVCVCVCGCGEDSHLLNNSYGLTPMAIHLMGESTLQVGGHRKFASNTVVIVVVQSLGPVQLFMTHGLQHARYPCPSPSHGIGSHSCPLSQ